MKVLRGAFKNRTLRVPSGIRPMSLRVKKSLCDSVKERIERSKVLDLFSGSGSLGIEALSMGALEVTFVDNKRECVEAIRYNLTRLKIGAKGKVILKDVCKSIKDLHERRKQFDLIFLDPPYTQGLSRKTLQTIDEYDILSPRGLVLVSCFYKDERGVDYTNLSFVYSKKYGQTLIAFYLKKDEKSTLSRNI